MVVVLFVAGLARAVANPNSPFQAACRQPGRGSIRSGIAEFLV
jgi:hypothetical protein